MLIRALGGVLAIVLAAGAVAAIVLALGITEPEPLDVRVARIATRASAAAEPARDPFAWSAARRTELERGAALGASHVLYAMSPGGVVASARRTDRWRDLISAAAERHGLEAATLEAIVFLESAGRPDVSAGPTPEAASGLAQIIPSTATELLGMEVDLAASIELTERIAAAKTPEQAERLRARRAAVDERFDPARAIEGAATYLEIARRRFRADDLAVASYHMGIGNLEDVLRAYAGTGPDIRVGDLVEREGLSYGEVFFRSTPLENRESYELLSGFLDESSQYPWKVLAAEHIMRRWREDPDGLAATAELATAKATLEEVFHPESETEVFEEPGDLEDALRAGELVALPSLPRLGWRPARQMGELAAELEVSPALYRALRPEALATLSYLAGVTREVGGEERPLRVTSTVRDRSYQDLLVGTNPEATTEYSLHTTGWSFDILRDYASRRQGRAFQYALDRLASLALIDFAVEAGAIHVTVSERGGELLSE